MSINKLKLFILQLLIIISLGIDCWARPKRQQQDPVLNEVTSQEVDKIPNHLIEEISALRPPRGNYKKRRSFFPYKQFGGRFYKVPAEGYSEVGLIPPGGANYYNNEVLPIFNYKDSEPEIMYY